MTVFGQRTEGDSESNAAASKRFHQVTLFSIVQTETT